MIVRQFAGFARSKMPLKFAANLSWLFQDVEGLENRYQAAKKAGFSAVEFAFPYNVPLDKLVAAKQAADVEQVLINAWPGMLIIVSGSLSSQDTRWHHMGQGANHNEVQRHY